MSFSFIILTSKIIFRLIIVFVKNEKMCDENYVELFATHSNLYIQLNNHIND